MQKKVIASAISLLIHFILLFGFNSILTTKKNHFSQNNGSTQVKISIKIDDSQVEVKSKSKNPTKKSKKKKKRSQKTADTGKETSKGNKSILAKYLSSVRSVIVEHKFINRISKKLKLKGSVGLSFTILQPNKISNLRITKSSNKKPLDSSALKTIELIKELPSIPNELNKSSIPISLSVVYK